MTKYVLLGEKELREEKMREKAIENFEDFEEVGEANFGSKINKISWKGMLEKAGIIILITIILVIILK